MSIQRSADLISTESSGETILVNLSNGRFFGFGEVGACVWSYLEKPRSPEQILARLTSEFAVTPEVAAADLDAFLDALASEKLTVASSAAPSQAVEPLNQKGVRPYAPLRLDRGTLRQAAHSPSGSHPDGGHTPGGTTLYS